MSALSWACSLKVCAASMAGLDTACAASRHRHHTAALHVDHGSSFQLDRNHRSLVLTPASKVPMLGFPKRSVNSPKMMVKTGRAAPFPMAARVPRASAILSRESAALQMQHVHHQVKGFHRLCSLALRNVCATCRLSSSNMYIACTQRI